MGQRTKKIFVQGDSPKVSDLSLSDFGALITETVHEAIESSCANCPIPEKAKGHVGHMVGVLEDIGEGDIRKGIVDARDNLVFVSKDREVREQVKTWVLRVCVVAITGGVLSAIWVGL